MYSSKARSSANLLFCGALLTCSVQSAAQTDDPFAFDLSSVEEQQGDWQWSGFLQSRVQQLTADSGRLSDELLAHLELKGQHRQWRSFVSFDARYDQAKRHYRDSWHSELQQAYLVYDGEHTDFSIGKQRVAWSVADGVSTIDRLNAVDLRDPIGNARTASRRPSWLMRLEHSTPLGTLEAVWLPQGKDRSLPEYNSPWESAGLHQLRRQQRAGNIELSIRDPRQDELGLRYLYYGQGFDWSLAWFNGYGDAPVKSTTSGTRVTLTPVRSQTYNAALALGLSRSTLRGELAYTPNAFRGNQRSRLWQAVAGWDRTFDNDLYANLQLYYNHYETGTDDQGMTFALSKPLLDDAATAGIRGRLANDQQASLETYIDYDYDDHLKIAARLVSFTGADSSALGNFKDNDYAELSLRWEI